MYLFLKSVKDTHIKTKTQRDLLSRGGGEVNIPLRFWISALIVLSMLILLSVAFTTNYFVVKEELEREARAESLSESYLLSSLTQDVLVSMGKTLRTHHRVILENWEDKDELQSILQRVHNGHPEFNSITIIGSNSIGYANYPNDLDLIGKKVDTEGARQGLKLQKDFISEPFVTVDGSLIIIVSTALYNDGEYYGMMNGLVRLQEFNFISKFANQGYTRSSSRIAVYDQNGNFIYHPEPKLIGTNIFEQVGSEFLNDRKSGVGMWTDIQGKDLIVGYSQVPITNWKVLSLVYKDDLNYPAQASTKQALLYSTPLIVIVLLLTMYLIRFITRPLNELSSIDPDLSGKEFENHIERIPSSYREMRSVKVMALTFLRRQQELLGELESLAITDPMTGLANRRRFNQLIHSIESHKELFGYFTLDIDNFKRVNDTYGHASGDEVLIRLADLLKYNLPPHATAIRLGGEEFGVLITTTSEKETFELAEHTRKIIEKAVFPIPGKLTVSIGAGYIDYEKYDIEKFLIHVDQQLYKAKQEGKNRVKMLTLL